MRVPLEPHYDLFLLSNILILCKGDTIGIKDVHCSIIPLTLCSHDSESFLVTLKPRKIRFSRLV